LAAMPCPTGVDPVKETTRGIEWVTIGSPSSEPDPTTTDSTAGGSPASSRMRASSRPPVTGVSPAGLSTTALPTASAGATDRLDSCIGKFHGEITATTPTGSRYTRFSLPGMSEGRIVPVTWWGIDDASHSTDRTNDHSSSALTAVPPVSLVNQAVISSLRAAITSAAARITAARRAGGAAAQSFCACAAASNASFRSAAVAWVISVSVSPVHGLVSARVSSPEPARQVPATGIVVKSE
jgi:hypothetical protein